MVKASALAYLRGRMKEVAEKNGLVDHLVVEFVSEVGENSFVDDETLPYLILIANTRWQNY